MKATKNVHSVLVVALVIAQLAASVAWADEDSKNPANCDLRIRPSRELINTEVVARLVGGSDYIGRNYWHDVGAITVGIVGTPVLFYGLFCFEDFYSSREAWWGPPTSACGKWGVHARANRTRAPDEWYTDVKQALRAKCNKVLRKKFKGDVLYSDGTTVIAEHHACTEPREEQRGSKVYVIADIVRGEPVYEDLTFEDIRLRRCKKLIGCSLRAETDEALEWIALKQMELGCS